MTTITSGAWWKAALARGFRTAAVVAIPYVPVTLDGTDYLILASAAGMGFILSILTSLAGIAEADGAEVPWWYATLSRVVKTVAQALVAAVGSAVLFTDVDWSIIPALVVSSAVGSLLLAVTKQLPEAHNPEANPVEAGAPTINIVASPEDAEKIVEEVTTEQPYGYHGV